MTTYRQVTILGSKLLWEMLYSKRFTGFENKLNKAVQTVLACLLKYLFDDNVDSHAAASVNEFKPLLIRYIGILA